MAGRWNDEWRDRDDRAERDWRDEEPRRWHAGEDRSWGREDRVFGERETGAAYNRPRGGYDGGRPNWQDERYEGVSPAMRRGGYDTGYRANPRFSRPDDDGRRFGSREADERWRREMGRGGNPYGSYDAGGYGAREFGRGETYSGGTGGYDYERGYGDGGRERHLRGYGAGAYEDGQDRGDYAADLEDRAREAGDFFRRTGEKVKSWFNDLGRENEHGYDAYRGARGLGPKGYKRSDERISEDAHQRLTEDRWLDASNINVSVSGGEVTLSGTVESREAKHRAERIVEDLPGVGHVQNNLRVDRGGFFTRAASGYGDSAQEARLRTEGDAAMETSATATHTTTRKDS